MNRKHSFTLERVYAEPASANIRWADIESLLRAVGCEVVEGAGSAVAFHKDGMVEYFHRPHPEKEAKRYQVRSAKAFLAKMGVTP